MAEMIYGILTGVVTIGFVIAYAISELKELLK